MGTICNFLLNAALFLFKLIKSSQNSNQKQIKYLSIKDANLRNKHLHIHANHQQQTDQAEYIKGAIKRVQNAQKYPYNCIGLVQTTFNIQQIGFFQEQDQQQNAKRKIGNGILISPNFVLTCAHNILKKSAQAQHITFIHNNIQKIQAKEYYISRKYCRNTIQNEYNNYDYALIKLSHNIKQQKCYEFPKFYPKKFQIQSQNQRQYEIVGYLHQELSFDKGSIINKVENNIILYNINTKKGQSGSPIFIIQNGVYYILGVHNSGIEDQIINKGILIDQDLSKKIQNWKQGKYFQFDKQQDDFVIKKLQGQDKYNLKNAFDVLVIMSHMFQTSEEKIRIQQYPMKQKQTLLSKWLSIKKCIQENWKPQIDYNPQKQLMYRIQLEIQDIQKFCDGTVYSIHNDLFIKIAYPLYKLLVDQKFFEKMKEKRMKNKKVYQDMQKVTKIYNDLFKYYQEIEAIQMGFYYPLTMNLF